jgi:NADH-quinone oxidoreductase subunit G
VTFPPGDAREDWAIIRALSAAIGQTLDFDDMTALRQAMIAAVPALGVTDQPQSAKLNKIGRHQAMTTLPMGHAIGPGSGVSFYMTCPISRASVTMAECVKAFEQNDTAEAAE